MIDGKHQFNRRGLLGINDDLALTESLPQDLLGVGNPRANYPGLSNIDYPELSPFNSQDTPIIADLKDNSVVTTNVELNQIDPQSSSAGTDSDFVADCSPNNGYDRKRSISLDNQRACSTNAMPWEKPRPDVPKKPSDNQNQTPKSFPQIKEPGDNPCGDRPSPAEDIPPMTRLVSCGGPIVDTRLHPVYVFNCVPGKKLLPIDDCMKPITQNRLCTKYTKTDIFRPGSPYRKVLLFLPSRPRM